MGLAQQLIKTISSVYESEITFFLKSKTPYYRDDEGNEGPATHNAPVGHVLPASQAKKYMVTTDTDGHLAQTRRDNGAGRDYSKYRPRAGAFYSTASDTNMKQRAVLKKLMEAHPNNKFLESIWVVLCSGKELTAAQSIAVHKMASTTRGVDSKELELFQSASTAKVEPPSNPATSGHTAQAAHQLQVLNAMLDKKTSDFIKSIRDQVARGKALSDKQKEAVRKTMKYMHFDSTQSALFN